MSTFLLLAALLVIPPAESKEPKVVHADRADLSGFYMVEGKDREKPYAGVAIIQKVNQVHLVHWMMLGGNHFTGIGVRQGDRLSVSWGKEAFIGQNVYKIAANGVLTGSWTTLPGNATLMAERLTFMRPLPKLEDDE